METSTTVNQPALAKSIIKTLNTDTDASWLDFYSRFDELHGKASRKDWYNQATAAYIEARPRYPDLLIDAALNEAKLLLADPSIVAHSSISTSTSLVEIGCGPGTATTSLAKRGFTITAIDPAPQNCIAARQQCQKWSDQVTVVESTFEDFKPCELEERTIHAIICPTSFHWISPAVACTKTAALLKPAGAPLILLWALPPMPSQHVCDQLQDIYDDLGLSKLGEEIRLYGTKEYCEPSFGKYTRAINESGLYHCNNQRLELQRHTSRYTPERYVLLLSTLSPYIALEPQARSTLFQRLTQRLREICKTKNEYDLELYNYFGYQVFFVMQE